MLRSLVGSEMCIRDSATDYPKLLGPLGDLFTIMDIPGQGAQYLTDLTSPCLLYTSDAADELPCVDLGGRRIINKKNTYQL